jgi:hypothetical protein
MNNIKYEITTLPRVLVQSKTPFAIISADKHDLYQNINELKRAELLDILSKHHLVSYELIGCYKNETEVSYLIPYYGADIASFQELITNLVQVFNQECAVISNGHEIGLIDNLGEVKYLWNDISFDTADMTYGYSQIGDTKFTFVKHNWYDENYGGTES